MDYQRIYNIIIENARHNIKIKGKTQRHHIIPRSFKELKNPDIPENLVHLYHREHLFVHLLLAKIWKHDKVKGSYMARAVRKMLGNQKINSRKYDAIMQKLPYTHSEETRQIIREKRKHQVIKSPSPETRAKMSAARKGWVPSIESRAKMSEAQTGKIMSEETKQKISKANTGKIMSEEVRTKLSIAKKGKPGRKPSDETKAKIAAATTGKKRSEETKRKMSEAAKNRKPVSNETKAKLSEARRKRPPISEETRAKMSAAHRKVSKT